ncbi:MAG TPA: G1 family glutamic endopeptidase [Solirubrobacteraceae bacterium]
MIAFRPPRSRRRGLPAAAAVAGFALALIGAPAALADSVQSSNWAGYAVHRGGVKFKRVTGTWRQPTATCTPGRATYSSVWVGLGGYNESSKALEQIGAEVDCNARGKVVSSAWYELVPAPSRTIRMQVRPGDQLKATVTIVGHEVGLQLRDLTKHHTFTRNIHVSTVDVSSAEWILETPSVCSGKGFVCQVLPLADFGTATITGASASTTRGAVGPISDRSWSTSKITLASGGHRFIAQGGAPTVSALPSSLTSRGGAFTVTYQSSTPLVASSTSVSRSNVRTVPLVRPARGGG